MKIDWRQVDPLIDLALTEDIAGGDVTTDALFDSQRIATALFRAKAPGVVAGLPVAQRVFARLDPGVSFVPRVEDGAAVQTGDALADASGSVKSLLSGERLALNFLQRMSGIATLARQYVDAVKGFPVTILDTRKTAPGLRPLDKYAVRMGGATNHRQTLSDLALVKDNHIKLVGSIDEAVRRARRAAPGIRVEVETATLQQVEEALAAGADVIMLDNMELDTMKQAVRIIGGRAKCEASGSVSLDNVRAIAATGVDYISVGRLTHSVPALDISMKVV